MANIRGKSLKATALDVAEGYTTVNPLFLKPLDDETIREFYNELLKVQGLVRGERIPAGDTEAMRWRNMRLQRLYSAAMVIKHYARERRILLV